MSLHQPFTCPEGVGTYEIYRMYHEELESLVKHIPTLKRAQFWMSFSPNYLKHLEVLGNVGMTRIDPVVYNGVEIIPLQFLKAVLPDPGDLGKTTKGKTCIGNIITGIKDGGFRRPSTSTTSAITRPASPKSAPRRFPTPPACPP
jgi:saccharopine dehydrogenase (NAD+, L-lysine forming)